MKSKIAEARVSYDATFVAPWFEFPKTLPELISAIHRKLNPRWPIKLSDIQALSSLNMADVGLRVLMFGGAAEVVYRVDRINMNFSRVKDYADIIIVRDCVQLFLEALLETAKETEIATTSLRVLSWLRVEAPESEISMQLAALTEPKTGLRIDEKTGVIIAHSRRFDMKASDDAWTATFMLERSQVADSHIYVLFDFIVGRQSPLRTLEEQVQAAEQLYVNVLTSSGFEPELELPSTETI
jgi:hypothetical protein